MLSAYNYKVEALIRTNPNDWTSFLSVADTRAGPNLIRAGCAPPDVLAKVNRDRHVVNLARASKDKLHTIGIVNLHVNLGGYKCRQPFVVVRRLAADVILGCTFLDEHVESRHPRRRTMTLTDGTTIPIRLRPTDTPTVVRTREKLEEEPALPRENTIRVSRRIVLPPQSETIVQAVCSHTGPVVLESKPQLYEKRQVPLTNGFIEVQTDVSFTIRVANFSAHERTLAKNQVLGYAKPAPETIFQVDLPENVRPGAPCAFYTSEVATSDSEKPPGSEPVDASLSGSSFRGALLELPVPEGVKTRVKEPEPLPSLSEIDLSHLEKDTQRRFRRMLSAYADMWDG